MLVGLSACGGQQSPAASSQAASTASSSPVSPSAETSQSAPAATSEAAPAVYFARAVNPEALQAVFDAIGAGLTGKVGVKLSTGEPGGNHYLKADLISDLIHAVGGTIVECNTAYGGGRGTTDAHYQVAADHGFTGIADF